MSVEKPPSGTLDQWHQLYHREIVEAGDLIDKQATKWLVQNGYAELGFGYYSLTKMGRNMKTHLRFTFLNHAITGGTT